MKSSSNGATISDDKFTTGHAPFPSEGANASKAERRDVKVGRPRRGRSLGRYPFLEFGLQYMERRKPFLAKSTYDDKLRKVRYLNRVFVELKKAGKVSTTNPEKMNREDVGAFIEYMREAAGQDDDSNSQNYIVNILGFLKQICEYSGNNVFARMHAEGEELPQKVPKDLTSLSDKELACLIAAAESMKGWTGEVARFITAMYPYTGLRASELRLAQIEDINTEKWTIWVRHPKGERKYARQRTAPILPPARPAVLRFLEARKKRVRAHGVEKTEALIPTWRNGTFKCYESTQFRRIKSEIEAIASANGTPIRFQLKTFRDTYCQQNIDKNPANLSAVSVTMGHATSRTTETSYGRIRIDKALEDLQKQWETNAPSSFNPPVIDKKFDITGYQ